MNADNSFRSSSEVTHVQVNKPSKAERKAAKAARKGVKRDKKELKKTIRAHFSKMKSQVKTAIKKATPGFTLARSDFEEIEFLVNQINTLK